MANLQGKKISNTYEGLIKTENNSAVSGSTVLTDGAGNSLQITVNTDGTLTAQTITASNLNISNWDEAYSWGDHSLAGYATSSEIATAVNNVINSAPTALDTLDELAAALNDDANFATTVTNLITSVSDRVTVLENTTSTQLTDAEIAAMGYIKVDTNTQRTDAEIDARIALNPEGFITSFTDTNTQLSDADIAAMGYIKTDTNTQLSDTDISNLGYIKTDTNTQRTDSEIQAIIDTNTAGFITSETDSQTLTFTSATGDLTISNGNTVNIPDNNTQRTDSEINALIDANSNGYITDYTVSESDVTAHEAALTITESQISDLSHFSGSYNDLTDKPSGIVARSDEEIEDVIGSAISGTGATSVVYNDAAGTIVVSSTDTNTQLSDADIQAFGYIKTDTNTQLSDADIAALGYIKVDTNTQLTDGEIAAFGYVKTDTQLTDSDIAAFGYIKTDTNTQRSDAEIQAIIDANSAGFITTFTDTNTQLSDADIAAMGYIKVDTNTQLSDSDIAALGYIKTDTNTQRTDSEINALITTGISGLATETYVDNAVSNLVDTAPTALDTLNELAAALGDDPNFATTVSTNIGNVSSRVTTLENANYISNYTVTESDVTAHEAALTITESQISDLNHFSGNYADLSNKPTIPTVPTNVSAFTNDAGYITTDTNTQLSDTDIAAFGYIKTDTNTQRTDTEINNLINANTNGYITDYTVTQGDVTAHQGALSITESQISDLSHFSGSYNDLTDVPSGITPRTDAEIDARIALNPENFLDAIPNAGVGAGSYGSTLNGTKIDTITIDAQGRVTGIATGTTGAVSATSVQTFTNKSGNISQWTNDSGYVTTDTNTQLSDADIAAMGYIKTDTNTQLSDSDIANFGYIKTDTNTQRTNAEIDARIALNPEGFVTTDTNTQLSDSDIAAFGYIKTDTNTQLSDSDISAFGYIKSASGIAGSISNQQVAFGNSSSEITSDVDFNFNPSTNILKVGVNNDFTGGIEAMALTADDAVIGFDITLGQYIYHKNDVNTYFGFPSNDTFVMHNNGSESLRVNSSGFLGIGENSPGTHLHVTKSANSHSWAHNSNVLATFENSSSAYMNIVSGNSNQGEIWFSDSALSGRGRLRYDHSTDTMEIWAASGPKAYFFSSGNVTISGSLTENSDISLKENITDIDNALDKVNNLRGVEYNMIADESKTKKIGFIAQEVEEVVPELVFDNDDVKSVSYSNTVALLVESIKELTDKVNDLQGQIDAMRA